MDQSSDKDILNEEISSWEDFEYALREENRLLFKKMLSECGENGDYLKAASSKDEYFSAESSFMVLILQQQKMINELIARITRKQITMISKKLFLFMPYIDKICEVLS